MQNKEANKMMKIKEDKCKKYYVLELRKNNEGVLYVKN